MSKTQKSALQIIIFLCIGIGLVWFILHRMTPEEIEICKLSFFQTNYKLIAVAFCVGLLSHFFRALRWRMLLSAVHQPKPTIYNTYFAVLIAYLANLAIPRLGEVSRCGILTKYESIPFEKSFGTVVAERIFDTLCLLIILVITTLLSFNLVKNYVQVNVIDKIMNMWNAYGNIKFALIALILLAFVGALWFLKKILKGNSPFIKILQNLTDGLKSIFLLQQKGLFILYSICIWTCYCLCQYICMLALPPTAHLSILAALCVMAFGSFGFIAPTNGGLGGYHLIAQQVLGLFGIAAGVGLALAWISWGIQTLAIVLAGAASLLLLPILNKKNN